MYDKQKNDRPSKRSEPTFDERNLDLYSNCVYDCGDTILTTEMAKLNSIFSFGGNLNALYQLWGYNGILLKGKVTNIRDGKIDLSGDHHIPCNILDDAKRPEIGNQESFTLKYMAIVDKNDFNIIK